MTDTQPTATIADELKTLKAIAAALSALTESQGKDDIFYLALELSTRLDAVSERCDRQHHTALSALTESQGRNDTFYVALGLSRGLDALSERCDRDLQDAKPIFDKEV